MIQIKVNQLHSHDPEDIFITPKCMN